MASLFWNCCWLPTAEDKSLKLRMLLFWFLTNLTTTNVSFLKFCPSTYFPPPSLPNLTNGASRCILETKYPFMPRYVCMCCFLCLEYTFFSFWPYKFLLTLVKHVVIPLGRIGGCLYCTLLYFIVVQYHSKFYTPRVLIHLLHETGLSSS